MRQRGYSRGWSALALAVLAAAPLTVGVASGASADEPKSTAMVLVLDASGSMKESDGHGSTKIESARSAVTTIIDQLPSDVRAGLMVYGNTVPSAPDHAKACRDINLVAPVAPLDKAGLKAAVAGIDAKGETPIGTSLQKAAAVLPKDAAGSIVLVSDGEDSCAPPAPCDVAKQLAASGVQLTVDTVGLKVGAKARTELTCISQATGGSYTDVSDTAQLASKLGAVTQKAARAKRAADGSPVEGTPAPADAPTLVDGKYTDSIVMGESLHWKIDLAPGQAVTARVTVDGTGAKGKSELAGGSLTAKFLDEDSDSIASDSTNQIAGNTKVVGITVKADDANKGSTSGYLQLSMEYWEAGVELPIAIEVKGAAAAPSAAGSESAAADATPSPSAAGAEPAAAGSAPTAATAAASHGYSLVVLLAAAGGALVAGLACGFVLGRRGSSGRAGAGGAGGDRPGSHGGPAAPLYAPPQYAAPPAVPGYPGSPPGAGTLPPPTGYR